MQKLINGYRAFRAGRWLEERSHYEELAKGQAPEYLVISCCDSRVDPATIFGVRPGELFVLRNVANIVPPYEESGGFHGTSAAISFAVLGLNVRYIVVMGHAQCGGIRSLFSENAAEAGSYVHAWMRAAEEVHAAVLRDMPDAPVDEQVVACEQRAILVSLDNLMTFPWVRERVEAGSLKLHGWYFDIENGQLMHHNAASGAFEPL